jgi:hypothetical protein
VGLSPAEGEGEAFADAVVAGGEDVGAAEAEDEQHLDGPAADAADLREVVDDGCVGHAADAGEGGDGTVEGFGGEVAQGERFVVGEAGGAELLVWGIEEMLGRGMGAEAVLAFEVSRWGEGFDQAAVDGRRGFAVELLVDDGFDEGLEGRLRAGDAQGEGAGALDEAAEFGIGGGERAAGQRGVIARWARAILRARHGWKVTAYRTVAGLQFDNRRGFIKKPF